jgi:hypothetical protein
VLLLAGFLEQPLPSGFPVQGPVSRSQGKRILHDSYPEALLTCGNYFKIADHLFSGIFQTPGVTYAEKSLFVKA